MCLSISRGIRDITAHTGMRTSHRHEWRRPRSCRHRATSVPRTTSLKPSICGGACRSLATAGGAGRTELGSNRQSQGYGDRSSAVRQPGERAYYIPSGCPSERCRRCPDLPERNRASAPLVRCQPPHRHPAPNSIPAVCADTLLPPPPPQPATLINIADTFASICVDRLLDSSSDGRSLSARLKRHLFVRSLAAGNASALRSSCHRGHHGLWPPWAA